MSIRLGRVAVVAAAMAVATASVGQLPVAAQGTDGGEALPAAVVRCWAQPPNWILHCERPPRAGDTLAIRWYLTPPATLFWGLLNFGYLFPQRCEDFVDFYAYLSGDPYVADSGTIGQAQVFVGPVIGCPHDISEVVPWTLHPVWPHEQPIALIDWRL